MIFYISAIAIIGYLTYKVILSAPQYIQELEMDETGEWVVVSSKRIK